MVRFCDLSLGYGKHIAFEHFSATINEGDLVAVTGSNGTGKSTLLKAIAGLIHPLAGSIIKDRRQRIAYLPQTTKIDRTLPADVRDLVRLGLWSDYGLFKPSFKSSQMIENALSVVGLQDFAKKPLDSLSGGQWQRALFARVLLQDADIILLDEPFAGIDMETRCDLMATIQDWHKQGRTVLVVHHEQELLHSFFSKKITIANKCIVYEQCHNYTPFQAVHLPTDEINIVACNNLETLPSPLVNARHVEAFKCFITA